MQPCCGRVYFHPARVPQLPPLPGMRAVYSLVKFGGVRSYVVATWTPEDLAACAELNLPCADVAALLPRPLPAAPAETRAVDGESLGLEGRTPPVCGLA